MLSYFHKIKFIILFISIIILSNHSLAQLSDECKLDIGTNLAGVSDWGTEIPFVNLMRCARQWYTKDVGNPNGPWNSEHADHLSYRSDGYPTHTPQTIPESNYPQAVATIWGKTDGWAIGEYTILWEGTGTLEFSGIHQNLNQTGSHRITFDIINPIDGAFEITIATSDIADPIHNIRVLMPNSESTYLTQPFNPVWLNTLLSFEKVRFMDWGQTNNWGQINGVWNDSTLFDWSERSQMDYYTWAHEKGIPYEMMVKLMNDYDLDGWVCVPHRASNNYMTEMATYFRDNLESDRHLTVEYSNEIWNWIFGQTHWVYEYGCVQNGIAWPNGIVPYVQNCMDQFSTVYSGQMDRITRAVGAFTGWIAITDTIVTNMIPGSFDAIAPTFYFGLSEDADEALDILGSSATVSDIAFYARESMAEMMVSLNTIKNDIADPINVPFVFYEGGQHLTPHPFGVEPSYAQALLDIQRDTAMYNLYNECFDSLRTLQNGDDPLLLMSFSLVGGRSARYGSWGILETMDQDTSVIPAPKYASIIENMPPSACLFPLSVEWKNYTIEEENCVAHILWETITETNNSHFIIERSSDGNSFLEIAKIDGHGNSNQPISYHFSDNALNSGIYYYRITQVDWDGKTETLGIRAVNLDCNNYFKLFPNPIQSNLKVFFQNNISAEKYVILNTAGKVIFEKNIDEIYEGLELNISLQDLPNGIYYFKLKGNHLNGVGKRFVKID